MERNTKTRFSNLSKRKIKMVHFIPLNSKEKTLLDFLYKKDRPMTANAIAKGTGMSYITVKKYLIKLRTDDVLMDGWQKKQNRVYKHEDKIKAEVIKKAKARNNRFAINPKIFEK